MKAATLAEIPRSRKAIVALAAAVLAAGVLQVSALTGPARAADPLLRGDVSPLSVDEGQTAERSGAYQDSNDYVVNLSSSVGEVSKTGESGGDWRWSYTPDDGSADSQDVTITAAREDSGKSSESIQFPLTVNNVAPEAVFNAPGMVKGGGEFAVSLSEASDPSSADTEAGFKYAFDCGSGYSEAGDSSEATCPAGAAQEQTVKGQIFDKDGGSTEYEAVVTVDSVKPTVTPITPKAKAKIKKTNPTIAAFVRDDLTNLSQSNIKLYVNGKQVGGKRYSYNMRSDRLVYKPAKLSRGKKVVRIVATDSVGNAGGKSWAFTILKK